MQQWACNTTSTTMQWGDFAFSTASLIVNLRASRNRSGTFSVLMELVVASGSTADDVPVQLLDATTPGAIRYWTFHPAG